MLLLVDGGNWLARAWHAILLQRTSWDEPCNAVLGFVRTLLRILGDPGMRGATHAACVWDSPSGRLARQKLDPRYKAHREAKGPDYTSQIAWAKEAAEALGVASVEIEGAEADDVIATLCRAEQAVHPRGPGRGEVVIISTDKDFKQLVCRCLAGYVRLYNAQSSPPQQGRWTCDEDLQEVRPGRWAEYLALTGDASDGIEGVAGVGPKTAAELLRRYGALSAVIAWASGEVAEAALHSRKPQRHAAAIVEARERLLVNLRLAELWDVPEVPELEALRRRPVDAARWRRLLMELEFTSLLRELDEEGRAA